MAAIERVDCRKLMKEAWDKLRLGDRTRPEEVFPRFTQKDFDEMRQKYIDQNGYVISIPEVKDIVHLVPKDLKTTAQIKQEKREAFSRILASPAPDWMRKYSSTMTFLDDYQDATSVIYPAISMLTRVAPKVMKKLLPVLGWAMFAGDLLNLAVGIGRLPMTGMAGKRLNCTAIKNNPFTKKSRFERKNRLINYKPGIADLIQVAQTTDSIMGVGLSLGPLMGFITDAFFGAYRNMAGDPVRFSYDVPDAFAYEKQGSKALKAAALIATQGQTFNEETHFWSLVMGCLGNRITLPYYYENDIAGAAEDPMSIMIPAPYPKDPLTIEVIKENGLDVDQGYGWPINGKPEISLGDLTDYLVQHQQEGISSYLRRHDRDWYGYVASLCIDQVLPVAIEAFDPTGESFFDDTEISRVVFTILKAPLLPKRELTHKEREDFFEWVMRESEFSGRPPGLMAIKERLDSMNIPYRESYPTTREPEADLYWEKDLNLSPYLMY